MPEDVEDELFVEEDPDISEEPDFNIFCVNHLTEEVIRVQDDSEICVDEAVQLEDMIPIAEDAESAGSEDRYLFHSAGVFYHMDEEEYEKGLVPEFYKNADDFLDFDEEEHIFEFTDLPAEGGNRPGDGA